jgi:hypothetical protein
MSTEMKGSPKSVTRYIYNPFTMLAYWDKEMKIMCPLHKRTQMGYMIYAVSNAEMVYYE